jgi:hypothetical protein
MRALSEYFRSQADWRRGKAEEYPDDTGNLRSAEALDALAAFVEPTDHGIAEAGSLVDALEPHLSEEGILGGQLTVREVSRYGYAYPVVGATQHEEFLEQLVTVCLADAYEFASEHEADPTGTLHPFELEAARADAELPPQYWAIRGKLPESELEESVAAYTRASAEAR